MSSLRRSPAAVALLLAGATALLGDRTPPPLSAATERLRAYVRLDTGNPPGNERAGALFLKEALERSGVAAELLDVAPGRASVYARLRGTGRAPGLLLHHHIDVVPAGSRGWTRPPFAGDLNGLRLVGRGTLDCKGLGVAQLEAFLALASSGRPRLRDVVLLATADEETGGALGLARVAAERPEWLAGVGSAIGEGGSVEVVVDAARLFGLELHQKGALWLRVTAAAKGGHAAVPDGRNASERIVAALWRARAFCDSRPLRLVPSVERALRAQEAVARKARPPGPDEIRARLTADAAGLRRDLPPPLLALVSDTLAVRRLGSDGGSVNALAPRAWAELDVRLLPGTDPEAFRRELVAAMGDPSLTVETLLAADGGPPSPEGELFAALRRALLGRHPRAVVAPDVSPGLSENRLLRQRGIETIGVFPFRANYYDQAGIHGTDEAIRVDWFDEGVEVLKDAVTGFVTGPR